MSPDRRTANLLGALATAIVHQLDHAGRDHPNQTPSAAAALNLLALSRGCTNGTLAHDLGLSHSATVRLIDKLEAAGLVRREPTTDGRSAALHLTPAGQDEALSRLRARAAPLLRSTALLTPDQQSALAVIAGTLLCAMVQAPRDDWFICRLCDVEACPPATCPVHQRALALANASDAA